MKCKYGNKYQERENLKRILFSLSSFSYIRGANCTEHLLDEIPYDTYLLLVLLFLFGDLCW
uniref:Uncharacterized protein n=1 Tax=Nelumbo nucifera TaxID=4432 RepID=A0A822XY48_NELNU|nr:TPA_asm: hypothetical protein HUJ06_025148 [Nelumbo nucifera]